MADEDEGHPNRVPALRFKQWLADWDSYDFNVKAHSRKPPEFLYMFSMPAAELRKLCDVYRRKRDGAEAQGIQRVRDVSRTGRIQRYVRYGYPFGDLREPQRTADALPLRKPGWLPTAIVVNLLVDGDQRHGRCIKPEHIVQVASDRAGRFELEIPNLPSLDENSLAPFEVIDGQHRLWAFDPAESDEPVPDDFELPVVAFQGLDIAWQAYLFWSINVSPKKINPSHAFDLYPLLRTQDWLERVGELTVYREARAQELTEILYSHPSSPWFNRINMLGEKGGGVSQAAWVRALLATFFGTGRGQGRSGLFQANVTREDEPLEWSRAQQAAFLIQAWNDLQASISKNRSLYWIRTYEDPAAALTDRTSMLNQDQGIRAVLSVMNTLFFQDADRWLLTRWIYPSQNENDMDPQEISSALESLLQAPFRSRMIEFADAIVFFDWRSLDGPEVKGDADAELRKRSYRGSGGYTALSDDVLKTVAEAESEVGRTALAMLDASRS